MLMTSSREIDPTAPKAECSDEMYSDSRNAMAELRRHVCRQVEAVQRLNAQLLQQLRQRERLRNRQAQQFHLVTAVLQATSPKRSQSLLSSTLRRPLSVSPR
ncbi:hypothetical protein BIW11_05016 [Tropilaelaps mercedesae]|uniref:Uncharacterized protein n=1 Tax=Tropilaelaps mercedesae TaxID=418985 RepID=A0A1V9WYU8_9ACAR|nr:hypothetical protein BIW11_05016 [Tropilaelaps mercedesae]